MFHAKARQAVLSAAKSADKLFYGSGHLIHLWRGKSCKFGWQCEKKYRFTHIFNGNIFVHTNKYTPLVWEQKMSMSRSLSLYAKTLL